MSPFGTALVLLPLAVLLTGLSMLETVVTHVTRARVTSLSDEGGERAAALLDLLERRRSVLAAVVVVRHLVHSAALLVLVTSGSGAVAGPRTAVVAAGVVVLLAIEVVAKSTALARSDSVALRVLPIARGVLSIPGVALLGDLVSKAGRPGSGGVDEADERPQLSEEELIALTEVAVEAEAIEAEEQELIESVIEFGDTIVREVMVPRPDMVTVDATWHLSDVMEVVILNGYSRIPVIGEGIDDVVGIAHAKDLMRAERDGRGSEAVSAHLRPAHYVPEQKKVSSLLPAMQSQQFHMAIVVDEYGGVAGLVTLEDLIEELVGEIVDEFDVEEPLSEPLGDGSFRVNGRMPLDEVGELIETELPEGDWDTVGGLLFGMLGHIPASGESVELLGHRLTALRVQGRRIGAVRIDRLEPPDDEAADEGAHGTGSSGEEDR